MVDPHIKVTDLDEDPEIMRAPDANVPPEFASATTSRTVAEDTAAGEDIGNPVAAADANGDALTYALGGTDAASFDIDTGSGQLMTLATLDYETKATYSVTVTASDSGGLSDSIDVMVMVTNVDEMGEVTLWAGMDALTMAPQVGDTITGAVMDPDGNPGDMPPIAMDTTINDVTWQWSRTTDTADMNSWMDIQDATDAAYMVTADDTGYYLRVMATYTDAAGTDMEHSMPTMMVGADVAPEFASATTSRTVAEDTAAGEDIGNPVAAADANGDALTYALGGTDAASFDIDTGSGQLMTLATLDYETKATYSVTVTASDSGGLSDSIDVMVMVTNVDEMGEVTLWAGMDALTMAPQVGDTITGAVMDPDGNPGDMPPIAMDTTINDVTWQWSRTTDTADMNSWMDIQDATDAAYMVTADDTGYYLRVMATYTDAAGTDMEHSMPTMMVGADVAPEFASATTSRTVAEDTAAGEDIGNPVAAADANGDALTYALGGTDAASFDIDTGSGQLMTLATLDYETKATYSVTVTASDSGGLSDSIDVMVMVTNVDEMGEVTLWAGMDALTMAPQVGDTITGAVMDPDGNPGDMPPIAMDTTINDVTWQWSRTTDTADMNSWMDIQDATDAAYMVTADDTGYYLRVMATYTDAAGTDMEHSMPTMMVGADVAPEFASATTSRTVAEDTAAGEDIGNPVAAADANGDALTYALGGTDAASFDIDTGSGQLMTLATLDYETKATYSVTVTASDSGGLSDSIDVMVMVTNVDEMGEVTLWAGMDALTMAPQVGDTITGAVMDPDGNPGDMPPIAMDTTINDVTWQWSRTTDTADMNSWMDIQDATDAAYMVTADDTGYYLRVMATYTDAAGTDMEHSMPTMMVGADVPPEFASATTSRTVAEDTAAGEDIGNPVAAADANGDALTYALDGTDAASFDIDTGSGQLMTLATLDYETKATYSVTVTASDSGGLSDSIDVMVMVTNVDEMGEVTLWAGMDALTMAPQVGDTITGAVMDPDGNPGDMPPIAMDTTINDVTWQWSRTTDTADMNSWMDIQDATDAAYMVTADDTGYYLRVMATYTDAAGTDMEHSMPTMMVGADVPPEFASATTSRTVAEDTAAGEDIGNPVAAADANGDALTYALDGTDAASFDIDTGSGQLMTLATLDYETKRTYSVTVTASDSGGLSDSIDVTITVTNVNEDGMVTLSSQTPVVGIALTASLTDADGEITGMKWQWASSDAMDGTFTPIEGATSNSYTPVAADVGKHLRATAMYTDGHGPEKTAIGRSESAVTDVDEADRTRDEIRLEIEEAILAAVLSDGIDDAERSAIEQLILEFALTPSS